jgi:hypothetical protein
MKTYLKHSTVGWQLCCQWKDGSTPQHDHLLVARRWVQKCFWLELANSKVLNDLKPSKEQLEKVIFRLD